MAIREIMLKVWGIPVNRNEADLEEFAGKILLLLATAEVEDMQIFLPAEIILKPGRDFLIEYKTGQMSLLDIETSSGVEIRKEIEKIIVDFFPKAENFKHFFM